MPYAQIELKSAKLAASRKPRLSGNFELDSIVSLEVELVSIVSLWNFELGPIVLLEVEVVTIVSLWVERVSIVSLEVEVFPTRSDFLS